jgi:hypothetical protein
LIDFIYLARRDSSNRAVIAVCLGLVVEIDSIYSSGSVINRFISLLSDHHQFFLETFDGLLKNVKREPTVVIPLINQDTVVVDHFLPSFTQI